MSNRQKIKTKKKEQLTSVNARTFSINLDPNNYLNFDGISILGDGQVQMYKGGQRFPLVGDNTFEYGYMRKSGKKKVLTSGPVVSNTCFINPSLTIAAFDHLFAIDTNTKAIGDDKISVAAVTYCHIGDKEKDQVYLSEPTLIVWYEYRNVIGAPENLAWKELIEAIQRNSGTREGNVGLIVDSDLGNHEPFNNRQLPIYDDFFLPERFQLLYGSTDGGQESLVNRLIRFSDKRSNYLIDLLMSDDPCVDSGLVKGRPYTHFRQWNANFEDASNVLQLHFENLGRDDVRHQTIQNQ